MGVLWERWLGGTVALLGIFVFDCNFVATVFSVSVPAITGDSSRFVEGIFGYSRTG
jgi:hypothetical protein